MLSFSECFKEVGRHTNLCSSDTVCYDAGGVDLGKENGGVSLKE